MTTTSKSATLSENPIKGDIDSVVDETTPSSDPGHALQKKHDIINSPKPRPNADPDNPDMPDSPNAICYDALLWLCNYLFILDDFWNQQNIISSSEYFERKRTYQ